MGQDFLTRLEQGVLVCDGAMGTMLYARGIYLNRCFDELNLSQPELVSEIHREYVSAGAQIIETNTFGANRFKLAPHGFDHLVGQINRAGAELARNVARDEVFVAGAIGPLGVRLEPYGTVTPAEAEAAFREQAQALLDGDVDLILLETFADLNEIVVALRAVRALTDRPVVAQMTFGDDARTLLGALPEKVASRLMEEGADVVGANCSVGPQPMLEVVQRMHQAGAPRISAQPNAGMPRLVEGRYIYLSSPEYHAEFARRFIAAGARIVGGCCGTTPAHIRAVVNAVRAAIPRHPSVGVSQRVEKAPEAEAKPPEEKSALGRKLGKKFVISVEVLAPRGSDPTEVLHSVARLRDLGIDTVNIPDGPRASARMCPMALAKIIHDQVGVEPLLHYTCRDRNLLGIQSDLLGAHALGIRNILAITGDPPKLGDYPSATAVFDVDSIGLTRIIAGLNRGADIAGNQIGSCTSFLIGVGVNPTAPDLERELERFRQKIEAGAEFALTQPVFDDELFADFLERISDCRIPLLLGIMPLMSFRMVEFLNNEVPGVHVCAAVAERMRHAKSKEEAREVGILTAQETLRRFRDRVQGIYLMPPFGKERTEVAAQVLEALAS
ncbi:MAG: bifunctional homocysteine S-methyltransferase/methylenetetrahydrofolate reductase [candidate division KSB1 bacterium]|nr:bifunctional homocysteine S-methyltransferase/methylenetetrahydrofolate reductase [candidate division KSB1 bacterium]